LIMKMLEIIGVDNDYIVNINDIEYLKYSDFNKKWYISLKFLNELEQIEEDEYKRLSNILLES